MSREVRKVMSILAVSVVLIAFPHSLIFATSYGNINPLLMYLASKPALLMCLNSLSNCFIYLILCAGFRRQWVKIREARNGQLRTPLLPTTLPHLRNYLRSFAFILRNPKKRASRATCNAKRAIAHILGQKCAAM
jgi:hypothetical protein